jgi:hypothetical protein
MAVISIPISAFGESGAQVVSAIERTIGGEQRIDLTVVVLDEKGHYRQDTTLLGLEETAEWKAGGQGQSMLAVKYYLLVADFLELTVARGSNTTSTSVPKPKMDSRSGNAYMSLADLRKFRIDAKARVAELDERLRAVDILRNSGMTLQERTQAQSDFEKYSKERNKLMDIITTGSFNLLHK